MSGLRPAGGDRSADSVITRPRCGSRATKDEPGGHASVTPRSSWSAIRVAPPFARRTCPVQSSCLLGDGSPLLWAPWPAQTGAVFDEGAASAATQRSSQRLTIVGTAAIRSASTRAVRVLRCICGPMISAPARNKQTATGANGMFPRVSTPAGRRSASRQCPPRGGSLGSWSLRLAGCPVRRRAPRRPCSSAPRGLRFSRDPR
jgi:hypothetical protein